MRFWKVNLKKKKTIYLAWAKCIPPVLHTHTHVGSYILIVNSVCNSGHPWFMTYADCSSSGDSAAKCTNLQITNNIPRGTPVVLPVGRWSHDSSQESHDRDSSQESHDGAECEYINALTAAVARIEISEPKRSRICGPVPAPAGLGLKTNLCTAFWVLIIFSRR